MHRAHKYIAAETRLNTFHRDQPAYFCFGTALKFHAPANAREPGFYLRRFGPHIECGLALWRGGLQIEYRCPDDFGKGCGIQIALCVERYGRGLGAEHDRLCFGIPRYRLHRRDLRARIHLCLKFDQVIAVGDR